MSVVIYFISALISLSRAQDIACFKNAKEMSDWKNQIIEQIRGANERSDQSFHPDFSNGFLNVRTKLDACTAQNSPLLTTPWYSSCIKNLKKAAYSVSSLNLVSTFDATEEFKMPPDFDIEKLIQAHRGDVSNGPPPEMVKIFDEIQIKNPGAKIIYYDAIFLKKTVIMFIPSKTDGDRWFHFALSEGSKNFNILSTRKVPSLVKHSFSNGEIEYAMGAVHSDSKPPYIKKMMGAMNMNCVMCHRTGNIAIVPAEGTKPVSFTKGYSGPQLAVAMNKFMESTANAKPKGMPWPTEFPAHGPVFPPERSIQFIEQCSAPFIKKISAPRAKLLQKAMNCQVCHNGEFYASLTYPIGNLTFEPMLKRVIESGHMPPDQEAEKTLSPDERKALYSCLMAEYFGGFKGDYKFPGGENDGILIKYLKAGKCSQDTTPMDRAVNQDLNKVEDVKPDSSKQQPNPQMIKGM